MMSRRAWKWTGTMLVTLTVISLASASAAGSNHGAGTALGPLHREQRALRTGPRRVPPAAADAMQRLRHWNHVALDAVGLDHTPVAPGDSRVFGEQLGPGRTARALAIVHIAVFDAVNAIVGGYESYTGLPPASRGTSVGAAIAQAAHDTLVALFPSQTATFDDQLAGDLAGIAETGARSAGVDLGQRAAAAILARRAADGSEHPEGHIGVEYTPSPAPGHWRPDPVSAITLALGEYWGGVTPFVLTSGAQFRVPPPPALDSAEYATAFDEVKALGGDGVVTPTVRTPDETLAGIYWAYDGTPGLGTPPRLYNEIAVQIAEQAHSSFVDLARLLALVNVALADTGIAVWESKYHYDFWRPITGIREADEGTGPTGAGDGNPATVGDPTFTPLGAQASNLTGPNFTPPFPAYPSGHAGLGATLFEVLRRFYGTDAIAFTLVSDELNGETLDNTGQIRPLVPRSFASLSQAEEENGQSRIYLGIHWAFDKTAGVTLGRQVADYVVDRVLLPVAPSP